jgi:hypothetical protein
VVHGRAKNDPGWGIARRSTLIGDKMIMDVVSQYVINILEIA